jgi:hypothetical protein
MVVVPPFFGDEASVVVDATLKRLGSKVGVPLALTPSVFSAASDSFAASRIALSDGSMIARPPKRSRDGGSEN